MAKRLFIGSISWNTTEDDLRKLFSEVGAVSSCTVITDRATGRSKGFAFVDMENDNEADKAIETLNGKEVDGRKIVVNEARPREERDGRGDFRRGGRH